MYNTFIVHVAWRLTSSSYELCRTLSYLTDRFDCGGCVSVNRYSSAKRLRGLAWRYEGSDDSPKGDMTS